MALTVLAQGTNKTSTSPVTTLSVGPLPPFTGEKQGYLIIFGKARSTTSAGQISAAGFTSETATEYLYSGVSYRTESLSSQVSVDNASVVFTNSVSATIIARWYHFAEADVAGTLAGAESEYVGTTLTMTPIPNSIFGKGLDICAFVNSVSGTACAADDFGLRWVEDQDAAHGGTPNFRFAVYRRNALLTAHESPTVAVGNGASNGCMIGVPENTFGYKNNRDGVEGGKHASIDGVEGAKCASVDGAVAQLIEKWRKAA
jgi:hypothetical protein